MLYRTALLAVVAMLAVAPAGAAATASGGQIQVQTQAATEEAGPDMCADPENESANQTGSESPWSGQVATSSSCSTGNTSAGSSALSSYSSVPGGFAYTASLLVSAHSPTNVESTGFAVSTAGVFQFWDVDVDHFYCRGLEIEEAGAGAVESVMALTWPYNFEGMEQLPYGLAPPSGYVLLFNLSLKVTTSDDPLEFPPSGSASLQLDARLSWAPVDSPTLIKGFVTCNGIPVRGILVEALTRDTMALVDLNYSGDEGCYLLGGVTQPAILRFTDPSGTCAPIEVGPLSPPQTMIDVEMQPGGDVVPPAPDGESGTTPLRLERLDAAGDTIRFTWDVASCPADDYNLLAGPLSDLSSYGLTDASCSVGTSGSFDWNPAPPGDRFFLVVGTDGVGTESSWGLTNSDEERNGATSSGLCGVTTKDVSGACP